jgi:hypothetical protein
MQYRAAKMMSLLPLACLATLAIGADQETPGASWKHQQLKFDYTGFTSHYTCDGLQSKVRQVLKYFGARDGIKVRATGCPGANVPSATAWVEAEFDALVPDNAGEVKSQWKAIRLSANRPSFMGAGECELVESIKPLLTTGFALRDLSYTTRCFSHEVAAGDYDVHGEVLQPAT